MAFWGQGCAAAELSQEEKATPSVGLSGPLRTWKLLSPPGSASLVFLISSEKVAEGGRCVHCFDGEWL